MVPFDAEFQRIEALPRKAPWSEADRDDAVRLLTAHFRAPGGTRCLKPIQAQALCEAADHGPIVGEIGAGQGKTDLSALLFTLYGAKRGLLLVPAFLRKKTRVAWESLQRQWRLLPLIEVEPEAVGRPHVRMLSYESLSSVRFAASLEEWRPDVIIADEAHKLARTRSARSRRFFRYIRDRRRAGDPVVFVPLSGTMRRKSIRECAHLYDAALGDRSPFPREWGSLEGWCQAIDEGIRDDVRADAGALKTFCREANPTLSQVRRALRDHVLATPGIISTSESGVDCSLVFQRREISPPPEVEEAMRQAREKYLLPNGDPFSGGVAAWGHFREIACGFAYTWDPPPPVTWTEARAEWNQFVSTALDARGGAPLASPLQVWNVVVSGRFGPPEQVGPWVWWRDVRNTFKPRTVPLWLSDFLIRDAEEWALAEGGIVWVSHTSAFFEQDQDSEELLGSMFKKIPYLGPGADIEAHRGPCAASYRAHGTGKNLQQFSRALWMCFPSSGAAVEQLAARHHRHGQEADEVRIDFYMHSKELADALRTARADCAFMRDLSGNSQRLLDADILDCDGSPLGTPTGRGPMWS